MLNRGEYYDLNDTTFGWRGRYRILNQNEETGLVYIENLGTRSKQYVSASRLRVSKCSQFGLKAFHK